MDSFLMMAMYSQDIQQRWEVTETKVAYELEVYVYRWQSNTTGCWKNINFQYFWYKLSPIVHGVF
jgi:hypothetical protein